MQQIETLQHDRGDAGIAQQVEGLLGAGEQQQVVLLHLASHGGELFEDLVPEQFAPTLRQDQRVDPARDVALATDGEERVRVGSPVRDLLGGFVPAPVDEREEQPSRMGVAHRRRISGHATWSLERAKIPVRRRPGNGSGG